MWRYEPSLVRLYPEVERFITLLEASPGFFEQGKPVYIARAPGRLDVIGGIADYSGSLVLEMPIAEAALVAVQPNSSGAVRVASLGVEVDSDRVVTWPAVELAACSTSYDAAREFLGRDAATAWSAYVAGTLVALVLEAGVEPPSGLDIVLSSSVPEGKGVSSSAAIEIAT